MTPRAVVFKGIHVVDLLSYIETTWQTRTPFGLPPHDQSSSKKSINNDRGRHINGVAPPSSLSFRLLLDESQT